MGGALGDEMHPITFGLKRAHLQAVAFGRKAVKKVKGMTPVRFDLLYALRRQYMRLEEPRTGDREWRVVPLEDRFMKQSELVKTLGLCRTTVSKMLKRLEAMGWISRELLNHRKTVRLTPLGLRTIWHAMRRVFRMRTHLRTFEVMLRQWTFQQPGHLHMAMYVTLNTICGIAKWCRDRSTLEYVSGLEFQAE